MCAHRGLLLRLQRRIETAHGAIHEAANLIGTTQELTPALPFRYHFLGLDGVLREPGAGSTLAFLGIAPTCFHRGGGRAQSDIQAELFPPTLAKRNRWHE